MNGPDEFIDGLEEQMGYFQAEQEFRQIANDETSGPGHDFARGWASAILELTGNNEA